MRFWPVALLTCVVLASAHLRNETDKQIELNIGEGKNERCREWCRERVRNVKSEWEDKINGEVRKQVKDDRNKIMKCIKGE